MKFPFDCIDEAHRPRWEQRLQPPLSTVDDFLLRDAYALARQLSCSAEDVAAVKRKVLERSLLAKRRRDDATAVAPLPRQRLLDIFDTPFPQPSNSPPPQPLTTGFESLDGLFHGGVPRAQVTCLAGDTSSGRTQLCLHTALAAAYHQSARVLYIDSNLQVTARRLHSMLSDIVLQHSPLSQSQQLPGARDRLSDEMVTTLTRIDIRRCNGLFQGLDILAEVAWAQQQPSAARYDLVVVDSLFHWFAPLLADAAERFPPTGGTMTTTASGSSGRPSLSASAAAAVAVNVHPLVAKTTLLLRAIAAGGGSPAVLVTTLASWLLPPSLLAEATHRSENTGGGGGAARGGGSLVAHHRHFAAYWSDAFDSLLLCANLSLPAALPPVALDPAQPWKAPPTTVTVRVAHRPPYFKQQPASARCVFGAPS